MAKTKMSFGRIQAADTSGMKRQAKAVTDKANHLERGHMNDGYAHAVSTGKVYQAYSHLQEGDFAAASLFQPSWDLDSDQSFKPHVPSGLQTPSSEALTRVKSEKEHNLQSRAEPTQSKNLQDAEDMLATAVHSIETETESEGKKNLKRTRASRDYKQPKVVLKSIPINQLEDYWYWMFDALTQKGVKTILHAWISSCHPGKQTRYPYKGHKKTVVPAEADAYNSTFNLGYHSAPEYWPNQEGWYLVDYTACRHLEPYHIYKNERQFLAKHLLLLDVKKEDQYEFNLEKLQRSTDGITNRNPTMFPSHADEYLQAIYAAAQKFRDFKDPNIYIDPNTEVNVYVTAQKTYKVKAAGRSGRDYFYGSRVKRRQIKSHCYERQSRSSSTESVSSEIKVEESLPTSRATSPDEDTEDMATYAPQSLSPTDEPHMQAEKVPKWSNTQAMAKKAEPVCSNVDTGRSTLLTYNNNNSSSSSSGNNNTRNSFQYLQTWQQYSPPQQRYEYPCYSAPSSASSASSFGTMSADSDTSGSYSPFSANGHFDSSQHHYYSTPVAEAQPYSGSSYRDLSTHYFSDGMSGTTTAYGPQQPCYAAHHGGSTGGEVYNPVNQFNYRRCSEPQQRLQFTPSMLSFTHAT